MQEARQRMTVHGDGGDGGEHSVGNTATPRERGRAARTRSRAARVSESSCRRLSAYAAADCAPWMYEGAALSCAYCAAERLISLAFIRCLDCF
jgi:hypothetical protein